MEIAIIGLGWVGRKLKAQLTHRGHSVYVARHQNWQEDLSLINTLHCVINCAGHTGFPNVDYCELDKNTTYQANAIMPIQIYEYCKSRKIHMSHFSSGCIYQGKIECVYADPNFFGSTYSISKGISDNFLKRKCLVFRIRMPFTNIDEPKNFLSKIYKYAKHGKLYNGGQNSLTDLDEAISCAADLIERQETGPFNLVNPGSLDMEQIIKIMKLTNVKWYDKQEFILDTKCIRSNCVIPAYNKMQNINMSIEKCIESITTE